MDGRPQALTRLEALDISRCNQVMGGLAALSGLQRLRSLRLYELGRLSDAVLALALQPLTG